MPCTKNNKGHQTIYIVELDDQICKIGKVNFDAGNFCRQFGQALQYLKRKQDALPRIELNAINAWMEAAYPLKGKEHLSKGFLFPWHIFKREQSVISQCFHQASTGCHAKAKTILPYYLKREENIHFQVTWIYFIFKT